MLDFDALIIAHTHPDHFDEYAIKQIPKSSVIFCQNESDTNELLGY
ncbi:MAG: hypothetical protein MR902_00550 [Campylobacter sp.]|nr:hypothetical protein [Campylobacter sp.]